MQPNPAGAPERERWPRDCDGERVKGSKATKPAAGKEHAMLIAFALALVGAAVLGSLEFVAAHAH